MRSNLNFGQSTKANSTSFCSVVGRVVLLSEKFTFQSVSDNASPLLQEGLGSGSSSSDGHNLILWNKNLEFNIHKEIWRSIFNLNDYKCNLLTSWHWVLSHFFSVYFVIWQVGIMTRCSNAPQECVPWYRAEIFWLKISNRGLDSYTMDLIHSQILISSYPKALACRIILLHH